MNIFLDTSTLFKLYHEEEGTDEIDRFIKEHNVEHIFLSAITKIEFESVVWKKVRTKEIPKETAQQLIALFRADYDKFSFVEDHVEVKAIAISLLEKYGVRGLRTLDAIQFATAKYLEDIVSLHNTSDKRLEHLFQLEHLTTNLSD